MTDTQVDISEQIRRRARALTTPVTVADGYYRWVTTDQTVLPVRDDKPRCIIMKSAPLLDPSDAGTVQHQFSVERWVSLEGLEGQRLADKDAKDTRVLLKTLFPDRLDLFAKEGDTWMFQGKPAMSKSDKENANRIQSEQIITLGYELIEGKITLVGKTFYAYAKNGNNGRVFLNYISEEPQSKFELTSPKEKV